MSTLKFKSFPQPFYDIIRIERRFMDNTDFYTRWDFIGLSSEVKPTPETSSKVVNGSTFFEADTSRLYFWTNDQWYRKTRDVQSKIERKMKW